MLFTEESFVGEGRVNEETQILLNKMVKSWNSKIKLIPDFINNLDKRNFKFNGMDFESRDSGLIVRIKKNGFANTTKDKVSEFSVLFNNLFSYSMIKPDIVSIEETGAQIDLQYQIRIVMNRTPIEKFFEKLNNLEEVNNSFLTLFKVKERKETLLRGLSVEKKEIANSLFETYTFNTDKDKNDYKFKEIEELLGLTIDLKVKKKNNKKVK